MTTGITYTGTLAVTACWCGIRVAIPDDLHKWAKANPSRSIYCPLGHQFVYRESEASKLREQLEREQRRTASLIASRDQARAEADHQAARAAGYKGALTRTKKRVAGGVCPCCNRSFVDLARHMTGQHPDYAGVTP